MKWSKSFINTLRKSPKNAEAISHKFMLRAGMIKKLSSGVYIYPPIGFKILQKVISIVREEMNNAGAQELLLPAIHPLQLWEKTKRLKDLGDDIIKFKTRHEKLMVLGPTHEEVITWLVAGEVKSYKQLPLILYQIQTKFRDEPRPRFGVIRTSEFIMKDAYSFDKDWEGLEGNYQKMYSAYCKIFERCGLNYLIVEADPGIMGGNISHEFMIPADSGEDRVVKCSQCNYCANYDIAERKKVDLKESKENLLEIKEVFTPQKSTVKEISQLLKINPEKIVKTMIYKTDLGMVAVLVRGDHEISETKLRRYLKCKSIKMANPEEILKVTKAGVGFSGPVGLKGIKIIADYDIEEMKNFVTGANKDNYHLINVNLKRDFKIDEFADIRYVNRGDFCPKCGECLEIKTAIEVGHIFKLGTRYSEPLNANYLDVDGGEKPIIMGCYGIGINRIIASFIEQNHDEKGIIWNSALTPFKVIIIPTNIKNEEIKEKGEEVYQILKENKIDALYDDRDLSAGVKFNDAELLGVKYQIIIGEKVINTNKVEFRERGKQESKFIDLKTCLNILQK
jgi:prolyl-tRNA synthetase